MAPARRPMPRLAGPCKALGSRPRVHRVLPWSSSLTASPRSHVPAGSPGTHAGDREPDPVDAGLRRDVESAAVLVPPREVVGVLGQSQDAHVFTAGREQPDAGRTAHIHVAGCI